MRSLRLAKNFIIEEKLKRNDNGIVKYKFRMFSTKN